MSEHPILFTGEMVRAILDGRKTVTRRVIRPTKRNATGVMLRSGEVYCAFGGRHLLHNGQSWPIACPYGDAGDVLWVRETWHTNHLATVVHYRADYPGCDPFDESQCGEDCSLVGEKWRPAIHMPSWACRLFLRVSDVWAERVQEITEDDIVAEGVSSGSRKDFRELWDSINANRGFGWKVNSPVWRVQFEVKEMRG